MIMSPLGKRWGGLAVGVIGLMAGHFAVAKDLALPAMKVPARVAVGRGVGTMVIGKGGVVRLQGRAVAAGRYTTNFIEKATVFDYILPSPVALPKNSHCLVLSYNYPWDNGGSSNLHLCVLVGDGRGGRWAVNTCFGGINGQINPTHGFAYLRSYAWDTSELGRRDAWVMRSLNPKRFNEYTGPRPPLKLLGFRLVVEGGTKWLGGHSVTVQLRNLRSLASNRRPDPYWMLNAERLWKIHIGDRWAQYGNYGWGRRHVRPFLRPCDLGIKPGSYRFTWEILGVGGWQRLASRAGTTRATDVGSRLHLGLPLLACGTYHLHLMLAHGSGRPLEYFLQYVVLRNHRGIVASAGGTAKPLSIQSSDGTNEFSATSPAILTIDSAVPEGVIYWRVVAMDHRVIARGKAPAAKPLALNLSAWRRANTVLWIHAVLKKNGRTLDVLRRVVGFVKPALPPAPAGVPGSKLNILAGQFQRGMGDWSEGSMPIGSDYNKVRPEFRSWLKSAQKTGYNIVELPAPWYEINPIAGVYQFKYLDAIVAMAEKDGLKVMLRINPAEALTPAWVPRQLMESQDGFANGLWSGSNVLLFSPASRAYRRALDQYLTALMAHYRNNPQVLGVTIQDLYADHGLLDEPWLGQYVDYSPAMRRYWIRYLRRKYHNSLAALNAAFGKSYASWEKVNMPRPHIEFDAAGRLKPRTTARWRDWMACKIGAIREFRLGGVWAARRGDPRCYAGLYASSTIRLYWNAIRKAHAEIAYGGMEASYPPTGISSIPGRFEPVGKAARTATDVDMGMTNVLLSAPPGFNGIFNYWVVNWPMATAPAAVQAAEARFRQWFRVVNRVVGAVPVGNAGASGHTGITLVSPWGLLLSMQNVFTARLDDYLRPYVFAAGRDKVRCPEVFTTQLQPGELGHAPYIYLPYCSDLLPEATVARLARYVRRGGRLVMEATSGYWTTFGGSNALLRKLGLSGITVTPYPSPHPKQISRPGRWASVSPIHGVKLAFRIHQWEPPINDQPTPWLQNIARCYLQPYRMEGSLPGTAQVIARYSNGSPAAAMIPVGKGKVLLLVGVVDWLDCPGLAAAIDDWGRSLKVSTVPRANPKVLAKCYRKGKEWFALGRRFIRYNGLGEAGKNKPAITFMIKLAVPAGAERYRVRDLLNRKNLGVYSADALRTTGVSLDLVPGEAFFLEAGPVGR
jgi:hypothetical protein